MTDNRVKYIQQQLGRDVLGAVELQGAQKWLRELGDRVIVSEDNSEKDTSGGAALFLSHRASKAVIGQGSAGNRIVWARLKGEFHTVFVVACYIPYLGCKNADMFQVYDMLEKLLTTMPKA